MLRPDDRQYLDDHNVIYEVIEHGSETHLILKEVGLAPGLAPETVDILIVLPPLFNDVNPDMFWCHPSVTRPNGPIPGTETQWDIHGRTWQRWSRHIAGQWRPGIDNVATYIAYIKRAIAEMGAEAA